MEQAPSVCPLFALVDFGSHMITLGVIGEHGIQVYS